MGDLTYHNQNSINASDQWWYSHQVNMRSKDTQEIESDFLHSARFYSVLLRDHLPAHKNCVVLDLPCGEGRMVYVLKTMGYENVSGYDLDQERVETGRRLGLPVHCGDILAALREQADNSVDSVFSMDFLEHMEKQDVIHFLEQAHLKIAPGGKLFVRTPCADNPLGIQHIYNDFTHKWAATSGVLEQLLHSAGFSTIEVFGEEPNLGMRYGFFRVVLFSLSKAAGNLFLRGLGQYPLKIWTPSMWAVAKKGDKHSAEKGTVFGRVLSEI